MPIKVLHIIETLGVGGMENGVVNIVNSIDKNFPSVIYCTKGLGDLAKKVKDKKNIYYKKCDENLLKITIRLFVYCIKKRPDIIHTHSWGTLISGFLVSKLLRIKLIHGEHGTVYFNSKKDISVQRYMLSRTDKNLFVSGPLKVLFSETLNLKNKLKVIHNGVDVNRFKPQQIEVNEYLSGHKGEIIIGTVGRYVPVKNHLWMIEALAGFLNSNIKLVIVGDGDLLKEMEAVVKHKSLTDRVVLYGASATPELLMNCFDIFVLPSISEGLSNTIIEAMSCGLPIVASDVGGNSDLVVESKNGFLYESNNKVQFLERINTLVKSKEQRTEFGRESREIINNEFSLQVMIKNYQDTYTEVMK